MKRQRQSWATRPLPPLTVERIERHLDFVADLMVKAGDKADLLLPIWRRLQHELEKRREADDMIAAARARLITRSTDRTSEQSS